MELDSVDVGGFEHGGVGELVGAGGAGAGVFRDVVAMGEVDVGTGVEIAEEARRKPKRF